MHSNASFREAYEPFLNLICVIWCVAMRCDALNHIVSNMVRLGRLDAMRCDAMCELMMLTVFRELWRNGALLGDGTLLGQTLLHQGVGVAVSLLRFRCPGLLRVRDNLKVEDKEDDLGRVVAHGDEDHVARDLCPYSGKNKIRNSIEIKFGSSI